MLDLKAVALRYGAQAFSAVATSAFRSVDRAQALGVLEQIRDETGFRAVIISQEQEARLGFLAAASKVGLPKENLLVWDAGGGSMQISYWAPRSVSSVGGYRGAFASEAMQRFLIEVVQGKPYQETESPNPILRPNTSIDQPNDLGIGGVHFNSNCEFLRRFSGDGCEFTRQELLDQAYRYAHLTDQELFERGFSATLDFAPYRVSGAALTLGFMNVLGLDRVHAIKVEMGDGILIDPAFWENLDEE